MSTSRGFSATAPPQGFVAVRNSEAASGSAEQAVLLIDSTLNPPIRVVGYGMEAVDEAYVKGALREALAYRRHLAHEGLLEFNGAQDSAADNTSAFRLVYEGDGLTALAIDIYGRYADVQTYSVHWDRFLPLIRETLWSPEFLPFLRGITVRRRFRKKRPTARYYYNPAFFDQDRRGDGAAGLQAEDDFGDDDDYDNDDEDAYGELEDELGAHQQKKNNNQKSNKGKQTVGRRARREEEALGAAAEPTADRSAVFKDVVVEENGLKYLVDLRTSSMSSGLFLDQRANRKWLVEHVLKRPNMSLLNLFAHTGAWSVAAAAKAKAQTTNVDHSSMCLDVAMANFRLNGILPTQQRKKGANDDDDGGSAGGSSKWQGGVKKGGGHEFVARDAFRELVTLKAKGKKFDVVLLDPPALARTSALSGSVWSAKSGYGQLVKLAAPVVAPEGWLVAFNNTRSRSEEAWVREIMHEKGLNDPEGRRWRRVASLGQDVDFRCRAGDERVGKYLKGLVLQRVA